jgi:hypothetical protein
VNILGFEPFVTGNYLEDDFFSLVQSFITLALNRAEVDEDVLAGILRNKAKPFLVVEPLYFATGHILSTLLRLATPGPKTKNDTTVHSAVPRLVRDPHTPQFDWTVKTYNEVVKRLFSITQIASVFVM